MKEGNAGTIPKERLTRESLYECAKACVLKDKRPTLTHLQRCLNIGYNKASELMDRMTVEGLVSVPDKNGVRHIRGIQERQLIKNAGFSGFLDFENYMRQRLKMWWMRLATPFDMEVTICLYSLKFELTVLDHAINFELSSLPFVRLVRRCHLRRYFCRYMNIGNHKMIETELYFDNALTTGFDLCCEHEACMLKLALLGIILSIDYFNVRPLD